MMKKNNIFEKSNSLQMLKNSGFIVPSTSVLSYAEVVKYVEYNNIQTKNLSKEKIKEKILSGNFSENQVNYFYSIFDSLKSKKILIRFSVLNNKNSHNIANCLYKSVMYAEKSNLLDVIKKCWSMYFDNDVSRYINMGAKVEIILQEIINGENSGIIYSSNPISASKNYIYIESTSSTIINLLLEKTDINKYTIRRETSSVDECIGSAMLNENLIKNLVSSIKKIEKKLNCLIKVEWTYFNKKIYFLYIEPIILYQEKKECIKNIITKSKRLWQIECYWKGENNGIKLLTNGLYYQNPILHFISPQKTNVYYTTQKLEEYPDLIFREIDKNYDIFLLHFNYIVSVCKEVSESIKKRTYTFLSLQKALIIINPLDTLEIISGKNWNISERLRNKFTYYKNNYKSLFYEIEKTMNDYIDTNIPDDLKKYISVLSINDILNIDNVNIEELEERLRGFIYYNGCLLKMPFNTFIKEYNYTIEKEDVDNI